MNARHRTQLATIGSVVLLVLALALGLLLISTPALAEAPTNDDFDDATVINALPFSETADASMATYAGDDPWPSCGAGFVNVWYSFTPAEAMWLETDWYDGSSSAIAVYTGTHGDLTEVACRSDWYFGESLRFEAHASTTYYFMVSGTGWVTLNLRQGAPPPPNDDFDNATIVDELPFSDTVNASLATWSTDDPDSCTIAGIPTIWYAFTPAQNMTLLAQARSGTHDTSFSVYSGVSSDLTMVACHPSSIEPLLFYARAGVTYYFMVVSTWEDAYEVAFNLEEGPPPPAKDDFDDAAVVPAVPYTDMLDTVYAGPAVDDPDSECFSYDATVWYAFTPTRQMRIAADVTPTIGVNAYGAALGVYTGERGYLDELACADVYAEPLVLYISAGMTYYFMVSTAAWYETGDLAFTLEGAPANDDFGDATIVTALPYLGMLDTIYAGPAADDPDSECVVYDASVWYAFTPTYKMRIAANLIATKGVEAYNVFLGVYAGEPGNHDELACTNLYNGAPLLVDVSAGETYYFMVSTAAWYQTGDLAFTVEVDELYLFLPALMKP